MRKKHSNLKNSVCFGPNGGNGYNQRYMFASLAGTPTSIAMRPTWIDQTHAYTYYTAAVGPSPFDFVGDVSDEGVLVAFGSSNQGYVTEIYIPWSSLRYKLEEGVLVPFDVQVIWSDESGMLAYLNTYVFTMLFRFYYWIHLLVDVYWCCFNNHR